MTETWTLSDLVAEAKTRLGALPAPKNGQVRAVPDDRTVRYYATLGLLDRPAAMRGRTALYGPRHLAQIVAIKRMQSAGHSLADIQQLWPTLDDATLMRISGVRIPAAPIATAGKGGGRKDFWKRELDGSALPPSPFAPPPSPIEIPAPPYAPFNPSVPLEIPPSPLPQRPSPSPAPLIPPHIPAPPPQAPAEPPHAPVELRIEIAPGVAISIALSEDAPVSLSPADIRALRAAAASLVTELANRGLTARPPGTMEEKP